MTIVDWILIHRKTFWRIMKKKSTEDFKSLPYICTLLSTSLWTYYGLIKSGGLLISTINGAGAVLEAAYIILFIIYAHKGLRVSIFFFSITFILSVSVDASTTIRSNTNISMSHRELEF